MPDGLTFASLYSGAGGLDRGFVTAGLRPVFAVDQNADCAITHTAAFDHLASYPGCATGNVHELLNEVSASSPDVVVGGPPCQGFSRISQSDLNDPRTQEVRHFMAAVGRADPQAFVMENVPALVNMSRWRGVLNAICGEAADLGYTAWVLLLNARDFGVPQSRERVFIVGIKREIDFTPPQPSAACRQVTVRDALAGLPPWGDPGNDTQCTARIVFLANPTLRKADPFGGYIFHGRGRPMNLDKPAPTLLASMGGNATPIIDQERLEGADDCWVSWYHRLLLLGEPPPKGDAPSRLRRITVEEAAVLQGFPTDAIWHGTKGSVYRQIGNSVPPKLGEVVAGAVRDALMPTSRTCTLVPS